MGDITIQFSSLADFLAMGTHGFYVWSAYGISAVVVVGNVLAPILRRRELISAIRRSEARKRSV